MPTIAEALRNAIERYPESRYRLAKDSGVDWGTIQRFVDGTRPNIRLETIDRLCTALGLELRPLGATKSKRPG